MKQFQSLAAVLFAVVVMSPASAQETLAWKFKDGDKFYILEKHTIKQTIKVLGNTEDKEEIQNNLVSFTVQKVTDDGVVLVQTIEELKTETVQGKADPQAQKVLEKMQGHQFTITLNSKGKITKFEGYDSLIAKISGNDANVEKTLRAILPVEFFKKSSETAFSMMPDKAVSKGNTWQRETNMSMGPIGAFKVTHTYKYDGDEKDLAVITSTAKLDYSAPKDAAGLPFKITKGTLKAETAKNRLLFDKKLGRPSQDTGSIVLRGNLTMEVMNMELELELNMEQSTETRVSATRPGQK